MNPRDFCRTPGSSTAIFFTYDFDPVFFERVVLRDLWAGGAGDILVVADSGRVDASIDRWNSLVHLGRRYQVVRAAVHGAFHPKVILRAGRDRAMVWIGTGNLTFGGWGGNREMSVAWNLSDNDAPWMRVLYEQLSDWCPGEAEHNVVERTRSLSFIESVLALENNEPSRVLLSRKSLALSSQLAERWVGRRFSEARILTGSTDRDGAFLNWMHDRFGLERATVAVDPGNTSFDPEVLSGLNLDVQVVRSGFTRPLHAKVFELSGPDGSAAIMGSANCSRSAWLRSPNESGNIEAIVVFDATPKDFAREISGIFDAATPFMLDPVCGDGGSWQPRSLRFRISEITWDPQNSEIIARFPRAVPEGTSVLVTVDGRTVACRPNSPDSLTWTGYLPLEDHFGARFADVSFSTDDGPTENHRHWVNDREELLHSARGRRLENVIKRLRRGDAPVEQKQILRELQRIGSVLLDVRDAFPDPLCARALKKPNKKREEEKASPVDLKDLVRSLDDLPESSSPQQVGQITGFSLFGVMRALFPYKQDAVEVDAEINEEHHPNPAARKPHSHKKSVPRPIRRQLSTGMRQFIEGFQNPEFAELCSARQLVQAAAYPLAVGIVGTQDGWVSGDDAIRWARLVVSTLFEVAPSSGYTSTGILSDVERRYERIGRGHIFREVVGDGTLWLTLLSSLSVESWSGSVVAFERALALRSILNSKLLLNSSDITRIARLVKRAEWDSREIIAEASRKAKVLNALENRLHAKWDKMTRFQERVELRHEPEDLLWNRSVGWAIAQEGAVASRGVKLDVYLRRRAKVVTVRATFYVNVTKAVEFEKALQVLGA